MKIITTEVFKDWECKSSHYNYLKAQRENLERRARELYNNFRRARIEERKAWRMMEKMRAAPVARD